MEFLLWWLGSSRSVVTDAFTRIVGCVSSTEMCNRRVSDLAAIDRKREREFEEAERLLETTRNLLEALADAIEDATKVPLPLQRSLEVLFRDIGEINASLDKMNSKPAWKRFMKQEKYKAQLNECNNMMDTAQCRFASCAVTRTEIKVYEIAKGQEQVLKVLQNHVDKPNVNMGHQYTLMAAISFT